MDGKGAWRDNAFVERLWRSVKYEEVYLRAYETEPLRDCRRPQLLRRWGRYEQDNEQIFN